MTAKALLGFAAAAAVGALAVLGVEWAFDSDTAPPPPALGDGAPAADDRAPPRDDRTTSLRDCVTLWNRAGNSEQRAVLNAAAVASPSVSSTTRESTPLQRQVLVLRYAGPSVDDVGVGEAGVNASRGDCVVAHPSQVLFLYTENAWHQVGYSPGLAFKGIPQQATSAPNAVMVVRRPTAAGAVDAGRIELTR
jgi:hypothetical protein